MPIPCFGNPEQLNYYCRILVLVNTEFGTSSLLTLRFIFLHVALYFSPIPSSNLWRQLIFIYKSTDIIKIGRHKFDVSISYQNIYRCHFVTVHPIALPHLVLRHGTFDRHGSAGVFLVYEDDLKTNLYNGLLN
jgi:uncharacterized membrane protein